MAFALWNGFSSFSPDESLKGTDLGVLLLLDG